MSFTVHLGWWIIPAIMTVATTIYGAMPSPASTYGDWAGAFRLMGGLIVTLLAWLIWSLFA